MRGLGGGKSAGQGRATRFRSTCFVLAIPGADGIGFPGREILGIQGIQGKLLPALGLAGLLGDLRTGQDLRQAFARIELVQKRIADHDAVHPHALQLLDLLQGAHAGLQDPQAAVLRDLGHQGQGLLPAGLPGLQVPAQHAYDIRVRVQRPLEIGFAGHFHDHVEILGPGQLLQRGQAVRLQQGGHEEHAVGAEDLALLDLVFLEDEVVAQQRHLHRGAHVGEVLVLPVEQEAVSGHGDDPGAVLHQALGVGGGPVGVAHLAAQRVAASRFGDDRNAGLAQFLFQGVVALVGILDGCRAFLLLDLDVQCFEYLDFFQHLQPPKSHRVQTPLCVRSRMGSFLLESTKPAFPIRSIELCWLFSIFYSWFFVRLKPFRIGANPPDC